MRREARMQRDELIRQLRADGVSYALIGEIFHIRPDRASGIVNERRAIRGLSLEASLELVRGGYTDPDQAAGATDEELRAAGVGPASLTEIRAWRKTRSAAVPPGAPECPCPYCEKAYQDGYRRGVRDAGEVEAKTEAADG